VDLVLTDFEMPGMNGVEVAQAVRTRWPHVRVGIITGAPELLPHQGELVDLVMSKLAGLEALREGLSQIVHSRMPVDEIGGAGASQPS
jgi:response regulator RpfG family c-di-GMP phosphodiesterase